VEQIDSPQEHFSGWRHRRRSDSVGIAALARSVTCSPPPNVKRLYASSLQTIGGYVSSRAASASRTAGPRSSRLGCCERSPISSRHYGRSCRIEHWMGRGRGGPEARRGASRRSQSHAGALASPSGDTLTSLRTGAGEALPTASGTRVALKLRLQHADVGYAERRRCSFTVMPSPAIETRGRRDAHRRLQGAGRRLKRSDYPIYRSVVAGCCETAPASLLTGSEFRPSCFPSCWPSRR